MTGDIWPPTNSGLNRRRSPPTREGLSPLQTWRGGGLVTTRSLICMWHSAGSPIKKKKKKVNQVQGVKSSHETKSTQQYQNQASLDLGKIHGSPVLLNAQKPSCFSGHVLLQSCGLGGPGKRGKKGNWTFLLTHHHQLRTAEPSRGQVTSLGGKDNWNFLKNLDKEHTCIFNTKRYTDANSSFKNLPQFLNQLFLLFYINIPKHAIFQPHMNF